MEKRKTLNAEKRKAIANVFQQHFEQNSKFNELHKKAIATYNTLREQAKVKMEVIVRGHQPQDDVDTIRQMRMKYNDNGGQLHHDNCFYVQNEKGREELDYNDNPKMVFDDLHIKFKESQDFLTSYYRDELNAKGLDADYKVRINGNYDKRNPSYYNMESQISEYLGFSTSNNVSRNRFAETNYKNSWENDFKLWVIGRSYCNERMFQVDNETFEWFKSFKVARDNVKLTHEQLFQYVNKKMELLKLGLKTYKTFDQVQELADKRGVAINESILNESSSMALSVYSPSNLAELLADEVEQTKEEKIAIAKKLLAEQQASLN
jgi:hypothetical protein